MGTYLAWVETCEGGLASLAVWLVGWLGSVVLQGMGRRHLWLGLALLVVGVPAWVGHREGLTC
jgi:hypothetical protein